MSRGRGDPADDIAHGALELVGELEEESGLLGAQLFLLALLTGLLRTQGVELEIAAAEGFQAAGHVAEFVDAVDVRDDQIFLAVGQTEHGRRHPLDPCRDVVAHPVRSR